MNKNLSKFAAIIFMVSSCALAGEVPTHEQLNEIDEQDNVLDLLNEAELILNKMDREFRSACAKAVGYEPFCNCIASNTPSAWGFADYIAITTKTKEQNGYAKLTSEYKAAYDKVFEVRDKCVALINQKP